MSEYFENMGQLGDYKKRREICVTAIASHRESLRAALPITADAEDLNGDYIVQLAISLNEKLHELQEHDKKIAVLKRSVGQ